MRRWICPTCGAGRNAPERMRDDDSRRYCFPCSEASGRLVRRSCPALEKRREAREGARKRRAKSKRDSAAAKTRAARERDLALQHAGGVDIRREARDLWRTIAGVAPSRPLGMFRLQIKRGKRGTLRGQGGPRSGATIWIGSPDSVDPIALRVLVLHELIHAWIGPTNQPPRNGGKWHGPAFRRLLVDAARAAWGVEVTPAIDGHRYETDRRIERALRAQEVTT